MTIIQSLILGFIEGLTEFIPVSSTAHMLLVQHLLGIAPTGSVFTYLVLVQLGAIAALLVYFWREFWELVRALFARPFSTDQNRLAWYIVIATIPALVAGALLSAVVKDLFASPLLEAGIRLFTAAIILAFAEWIGKRNRGLASMTWLDGLIIGVFQVLAVFPGASRSGTAIGGGMLRNLDRLSATRFAFLMSAPVMLAAGTYESIGAIRGGGMGELLPALLVGVLASGIVGWISIRWFLSIVSRHRLYSFAAYCAVLGIICLLLQGL
ncbi:MAG TPA: undecaprenyl-diphosphatase UppP [Anaerolineales bacterium]